MRNTGIKMKNKIKKSFFAVGIVTGALVALIPMTTYAATSKEATSHVEISVMSAITLEVAVDGEEDQRVLFDEPVLGTTSEAEFTATVSTNQAYTLSLNALDGQTDLLPAGTTSEDAPAGGKIPGTGEIVEGKSSWGVKLSSGTDYEAIPATIAEFYEGQSSAQDEETKFTVGLATGTELLNGTYSSTLVVTAATK